MKNDIEDSKIIDFLYGEMSKEEQILFQKEMDNKPELKLRIKELETVQNVLGEVSDEEVVPPSFVFGTGAPVKQPIFFHSQPFKWAGSIAAGLLILLFAAYTMNFNVTKNDNGLLIGFGESKSNTYDDLNKQDIQIWMKEAMAEYDKNTNSKMANLESKLVSKIDSQDRQNYATAQDMIKQYKNGTDQLMQLYVNQVNDENKKMIENFFLVSNDTQQKYMQSVLADFNEFYQNQRSYDLEVIETSMDLLKNNQDVQQLEQDNLLANLYDIVQTQSK